MSEHVIEVNDNPTITVGGWAVRCEDMFIQREEIVRCKDCKHLDMPDWDNNLAACYGEPPLFCMQLSYNEWRMDGNRRVADPTFLEVEPDDFCKWGERRSE